MDAFAFDAYEGSINGGNGSIDKLRKIERYKKIYDSILMEVSVGELGGDGFLDRLSG